MQEIITFTQDELVQMLEGGEIMREEEVWKGVDVGTGVQFRPVKQEIIFKMEDN